MGVRVRRKVKGGPWWVFGAHQGRRTSKLVGERPAALAVAKALREAIPTKDFRLPLAGGPTFQRDAEAFLTSAPALRSIRTSTLENYRSFVRHHLLPAFGPEPVTSISAERIEAFIVSKLQPGGAVRRTTGLRASSLRTGLTVFRLILQRSVRTKHLAANPFSEPGRLLPRRADAESPDPFTGDEIAAVLAAAERMDPDVRTLIEVWARTGLRAGEVAALQEQDIDWARGTVTVRATWSRKRLGPPKVGGVRVVSFLHPVCEPVGDWRPGTTAEARGLLLRLRHRRLQSIEPTGFVFGGLQPMDSMQVHRVWKRVLRAAGVRYRSPEQLRHSFASCMLSRNAPPLYVQQQGGWSSAGVLFRIYSRWLPQGGEHPAAPQVHPRAGAEMATGL